MQNPPLPPSLSLSHAAGGPFQRLFKAQQWWNITPVFWFTPPEQISFSTHRNISPKATPDTWSHASHSVLIQDQFLAFHIHFLNGEGDVILDKQSCEESVCVSVCVQSVLIKRAEIGQTGHYSAGQRDILFDPE